MRNILTILIAMLMAASCSEYDIEEILMVRSDISVTMKGKEIYAFNPDKGQIGFNAEKNEYRFFDDDMINWVVLVWDEHPVNEEQQIRMDIDWGTRTSFKTGYDLSFEVKKTDDSGLIWLWNDSEKIGIVIKDFK